MKKLEFTESELLKGFDKWEEGEETYIVDEVYLDEEMNRIKFVFHNDEGNFEMVGVINIPEDVEVETAGRILSSDQGIRFDICEIHSIDIKELTNKNGDTYQFRIFNGELQIYAKGTFGKQWVSAPVNIIKQCGFEPEEIYIELF